MTSLVERLRVRSDRGPIYNADVAEDSDEEFLDPEHGSSRHKIEKIVRDDGVRHCSLSLSLSLWFSFFGLFSLVLPT